MTTSRQLDDRNIERRRARLGPRRAVALTLVAVALAATAFVLDSLRRSVAQLGAAVPVAVQRDVQAAPQPSNELSEPHPARAARPAPPLEAAAATEPESPVELEPSESIEPIETFEPEQLAPPGPLTGAEFAELVESGALGDVGADAEAVAELRRALDAAALEAQLDETQP